MKKYTLMVPGILLMVFLLCSGFELFNEPVELDPGSRRVYQVKTVDETVYFLSSGGKDSCFAITGGISDIGKKYDSFRLLSEDGKTGIDCMVKRTDPDKGRETVNKIAELSPGDRISAYGIVKKKLVGNGYNAEIYFIGGAAQKTGDGVYSADGRTFRDHSNTRETRIVNPGKNMSDIVTFRVPDSWKAVEREIDNKGDHIYGVQYNLNRLKGEKDPECLYVFYLDYNKNLSDRSQYDNTSGIEASIVRNILNKKDAGKCPESILRAPYGTEYHYYDDKYESGDNIYHLEFVFRENGTKGILVFMYIYRMPEYADDIMYVMRTADIFTSKG